MRLLFVGNSPETCRLADSFAQAGIASVVRSSDETEAILTIDMGTRYDWVLAERDVADWFERQLCSRYALQTPVIRLDWARDPATALRLHPDITGDAVNGLIADGESQWVLEYHTHRSKARSV